MSENTVSQRIANIIYNQILLREYNPGDKLPTERELAQRHGVSRIPVREAMKILEQLGIVETRHGSGNYVKLINEEKLIEQISQYPLLSSSSLDALTGFWKILELYAGGNAALHRSSRQMDEIKRLADECANEIYCALSGQPFAFSEADLAFHSAIAEAAGNRIVTGLLIVFHKSIRIKDSQVSMHPNVLRRLLGIHESIVQGLEKQDPEMTKNAVDADISLGGDISSSLMLIHKPNEVYGL